MAVNRQLGVNAAIVLKFGGADQSTIKGLNQLTLPALTRSKIKSEEFGVDFAVNDVGGGEHGDISYSGNMVLGDTKGQDQLKAYLLANTKFTDARVYIDTVAGHFLAADIANDTEAGFQVIAHTPGSVNKNGTFPFSGSWSVNGLYAIFTVHRPEAATPNIKLAFVTSATPLTVGGTITDSTSQFVVNGFVAGQTLIVEGSVHNDGTYLIKTVVAGTITLEVAGTGTGTLVNESAFSVRVATTTTLPACTPAGTGVGKTLTANGVGVLTIDTVATVLNDLILVKNQAAADDNGIYKVTTEGTAGVAFILTRDTSADQDAEVESGIFTFVTAGTANINKGFVLTTADPIVVDTTNLTFTEYSTTAGITLSSLHAGIL